MTAGNEAAADAALPRFDDDYALDAATVAAFRDDGFACVRSLASATEVAAYRPLLCEAALTWRYDKRPLEQRGTYGKAFIQSVNLWRRHARIAGFSLARRFAHVAAQLLEVPAVRIYHDQALFKEPGGGHTPWHQDQTYWPFDSDRTISMWMPLVDIRPEVGSMYFVPGSYRQGDLNVPGISDETQTYFDALIQARGWQPRTFGALRAGDATFHAGWTLHGAKENPTAQMREVMTIIYFADGLHVAQPSKNQEGDLRMWLPGCKPGELAASVINPRL